MAVPHFSVSIVARGTGRSAVLSAAYRHCARMEFEREARTIDYTRKKGLLHEELAIPADSPAWLRSLIADRSVSNASEGFWNRVETSEKRVDAQLAKDVTIALPIELSAAQNIELVRDFVATHVTAKGMVADWVYHDAPGNPHVHLMMTLRPLAEGGFGAKKIAIRGLDGTPIRNDAGKIVYVLWAGGVEDFNSLRDGWFACQNRHLLLAGIEVKVDGRSFERQGIELTPTAHLGVGTKAVAQKAAGVGQAVLLDRVELQEERRVENARRIRRNPNLVLDLITREKSVFDARDVAKVLHRYVDDEGLFRQLMARILQSPQALRLEDERIDLATGQRSPARYTTRDLIRLEAEMANRAIWLSQRSSHGIGDKVLEATFARSLRLSDEQKTAIEHLAGRGGIAAVVGRAGAGKTTMMKAAREAWEAAGYTVIGGALAGKAAEGLEKDAGLISHTLSSWELRWGQGRDQIDDKTVFVLDEAGMVSSRQMAFFVETVTRAGGKMVLVGDPEQLQPIEAGAAFRAIADRIGYAELDTIYRQKEPWMRDASLDLARGNIGRAIDAYRENDRLMGSQLKAEAVASLIADWAHDYDPKKSSLMLAHLRRDVRALNERARAVLIDRGILTEGFAFETADGGRNFAAGDQIVFLRNEASLGVKNGTLARVVEASAGRIVAATGAGNEARQIVVQQRFYGDIDHGYATTIHKSQGATVDRVKVLVTLSLDRHLTYVAMTRHREDLALYYGRRSFDKAGGLVPMLSRRNVKETTLDYAGSPFYRQALRFAENRGLHLLRVARSLLLDKLEWTFRQKQHLTDLTARLAKVAVEIGIATRSNHKDARETKPLVAAISKFSRSIDLVVEETLDADPLLKTLWQDVSLRFRLVYARPETAFRSIDVDGMLNDQSTATATLARITAEPAAFGDLRGRADLFASPADRADRDRAVRNVQALVADLDDYVRQRAEAWRRHHAAVSASRRKMAVEIPALSSGARMTLERVGDAIDRNDAPAGLEYAHADGRVKAELDRFAKAVAERFGMHAFLSSAAKEPHAGTFTNLMEGLSVEQKSEIRAAWSVMRAAQQLAAHERAAEAVAQAKVLRQAQMKGLSLK
jgi:Ti-type conjugative transfer relaxase TraA